VSNRPVKPRKWASACANAKMLAVDTCSGYRGTVGDPAGPHYDFSPDVTDEALGAAVLDCLAHSRFLDTSELRAELFHPHAVATAYASWIERLMQFGGVKTKRALLKDMDCCWIEQDGDAITIQPTHHEKLEGWSGDGFTDADHVVISAQESPSAIGAALREAFRRCT
jgi:hypothetical protein